MSWSRRAPSLRMLSQRVHSYLASELLSLEALEHAGSIMSHHTSYSSADSAHSLCSLATKSSSHSSSEMEQPSAHLAGFSARQRKDEVERLNEQLRKINISLRQQARSGTIYAPGLTYAPAPTFTRSNAGSLSVVEPQQPEAPMQPEVCWSNHNMVHTIITEALLQWLGVS